MDCLCTIPGRSRRKSEIPQHRLIHRNNPAQIEEEKRSRYASSMAILSDRWIREQAQKNAMIEPFVEAQRREGCISYGLSSYGYDARVSNHFKIFTNVDSATVDPKDFALPSAPPSSATLYNSVSARSI